MKFQRVRGSLRAENRVNLPDVCLRCLNSDRLEVS
jgi:hypothetical protein